MSNILIIYHHKTGCVLSKLLVKLYEETLGDKIHFKYNHLDDNYKMVNNKLVKDFNYNLNLNSKYKFYLQASPNYIYNIFNNIDINKIIHFIRDPYSQSLSNFAYHTQSPTPEKWFLKIKNDKNKWFSNTQLLHVMLRILDIDLNIIEETKKYLKNNFKPDVSKSYYENLLLIKKNNICKAFIIETLRFIFETKHILKMACMIKINQKNRNKILYLKIEDFKNDTHNTIKKFSNFIFSENIDNKIILKKYNNNLNCTKKKGTHFNKMNSETKEKLINELKKNKIIFEIFHKVNRVIKIFT
tara:strand:+ start:3562 stop:4461 length:900 start_codon:yes stop_codon:yes gene_type:complete